MDYSVKFDQVRLRKAPSTTSAIQTVLSANTLINTSEEVKKEQTGSPYWWYLVSVPSMGDLTGWIRGDLIQPGLFSPPPIPTPHPAITGSIIGLHFHEGANSQVGREIIARHKTQLATVINDVNLANQLSQDNPDMTVIWRRVTGDHDPNPTDGNARWQELSPYWQQLNPKILVQIANEWFSAPNVENFRKVYIDAMGAAQADGRKITVGDFGVGTPEPEDLPQLDSMFDLASQLVMPINYHAYGSKNAPDLVGTEPDYYELRWLRIAERKPLLKFVLGECGTYSAKFISSTHMIEEMLKLRSILAPYQRQLLGAAWWTLGGQGAYGFDYSSIDSALGDYEKFLANR